MNLTITRANYTTDVCDVCTTQADELTQCEYCLINYCCSCGKISERLFAALVEFKELHWFCPKCDQTAIRAIQQLNNSSRSDNILSAVTSTISTAIQSLQDTLKTTIQNLVTATVSKPTHQSASNMETDAEVSNSEDFLLDSVENITSSLANEQKEREKRKLNVIVYNVPESNATTGLERKEEDLTRLNGLFKDYLQVSPDITKVIRLGKKGDKPRLLKVSVASTDQRSNILRNKVKFKQDSNPEHVKRRPIEPTLLH